MNFIVFFLEDSVLNKQNLRKIIKNKCSDKKLIRFFVSCLIEGRLCVEILVSDEITDTF
jgi:hypothetical protein